ncbi:hypothetical protein LTR85_007528 [Meristemomyces frigidus]|nr:hypothetical protein LTR85_007528 [Meristemomyces frigidus]
MSQDHKRRRSVAVDPASHGEGEGLNNLNRWSYSTNSSVTSIASTRKVRASSGAGLQILTNQALSPQKRSKTGIDHSPKSSPHRKPIGSRHAAQRLLYSPEASPNRLSRRSSRPDFYTNSLTALPPLHTETPALINDTESPSTIQTITTPSTQSSYAQDYFVEDGVSPRNTAKNKKPVLIRNHTAPMSGLNHSRTPGPESAPHETLRRTRTSEEHEQEDEHEHGPGPSTARDGSGGGHRRSRTRENREKDKKAMLSKALQKANTAVLLDNAQNFEGALDAYSDACRLLQQVMDRSSGADDKRKLEAIKVTYTNRIEELRQLESSRPNTADDKDLPARPMSDGSMALSPTVDPVSPMESTVRDSAVTETATMQRIVDVPRLSYPKKDRDSFFSRTMEAVDSTSRTVHDSHWEQKAPNSSTMSADEMHSLEEEAEEEDEGQPAIISQSLTLPPSRESAYMPAPLSPRKPPSPMLKPDAEEAWHQELDRPQMLLDEAAEDRDQVGSNDQSVSWLDTIDESGSDCASSVHSFSKDGPRRKHIRGTSGETDPDFDAAFDAAVEAAYDEGFEPDMEARTKRNTAFKHAQTESVIVQSGDIREVLSPTNDYHPTSALDVELDDEEEERLLDEITSDYAQGFNFDLSSKSALPRQSDSSGYSRSTWQSSQASGDRNTAATSLSTVAEDAMVSPTLSKSADTPSLVNSPWQEQPPPSAPPVTALPRLPSASGNRLSGVRSRRLSGQANTKQLKIETTAKPDSRKRASTFHHSPASMHDEDEQSAAFDRDFKFGVSLEPTPSDTQHDHILNSPPSLDMRSAASDSIRPQTAAAAEQRKSMDDSAGELLPSRPHMFRKNKSSVSLREHTVLLSSPDDSAPSIITPMSSNFMAFHNKRSQDPLTSQRARYPSFDASLVGTLQTGGAYLFDTSLSAAQAPTSPRSPTSSTQPAGLEPCPESFLLRPFWLMRGIASTLTHAKGGFLTTRLFVPREVWHTRGVKLKSVEDKVANCDLLTAALGRLAGVDTFDADAVMDELQSFEEVMERVQAALSKKLGSDVGLQGVSSLFKDASAGGASGTHNAHGDTVAGAERASKSKEGKGYLTSWRKLRSKSSGTPLTAAQPSKTADKEQPTMPSVPMTSFVPVERRGNKKDARNLAFEGPQREYMGSLARLFEGAQVLDQIARQVEDPGLKHSSPTHVGLELSIRHAAEFFGFYVCRFVLADLGILLDKFVKRGTEWVLA